MKTSGLRASTVALVAITCASLATRTTVAQEPVSAKYETLFQELDQGKVDTISMLSERMPAGEAESAMSRLPYGQLVHSQAELIKNFRSLEPGDDPKVVAKSDLPSARLERLIDRNNFLPAYFLSVGNMRQSAVARIRLKQSHSTPFGTLPAGSGWGTGFLISDSLLMTNHHVIEDAAFAKNKVKAQFNFQVDLDGTVMPVDEYDFDPDSFFYANPDLDFCVVRVKPKIQVEAPSTAGAVATGKPPGILWGHIAVAQSVFFAQDQPVNIIQHPAGRHKEVAIQQNEITEISATAIRYRTDTEPGSSGSPVFDNQWVLIALHHSAGTQSPSGDWLSNEGIRIDRIIADLQTNAPQIIGELGVSD